MDLTSPRPLYLDGVLTVPDPGRRWPGRGGGQAAEVCLACTSGTAPPSSSTSSSGPSSASVDPAKADAVMRVVRDAMADAHLKAVIVSVTIDGKVSTWLPDIPTRTR
ncbi:hypothetical protein ACQP04_23020 [Pseudonocardia halophobica]|uniref:hypothetical protein n=1 Tax=Pseudonocardia halophobica TaxID=29401 RepID=UPI003D8DE2C9